MKDISYVTRADGSGVFCEQFLGEAEYRRFQVINDDYPELTAALNEMGHANWTVCPVCRVDDFVHVDGCRIQVAGEEEMAVADRTALVVLRQSGAVQTKEVVNSVGSWTVTENETLELYSTAKELVATFRDWSFVKFMDAKNGA